MFVGLQPWTPELRAACAAGQEPHEPFPCEACGQVEAGGVV